MDLSVKTINLYIELLNHVQMEWETVSGVNRQRRGEVGQYQGKSSGQQAIVQSSHITEDMYRKFGGLEKRDLQGLLDIAKYAWIDGKKGVNIMPDGAIDYFSMEPDEIVHADLGIFMTDSTKEVEKLNYARELAQSLLQNGGQFSMALDTIEGESFLELKEKIKQAEQSMQELSQAQSQAQQQAAAAEQEFEMQKHQDEMTSQERDRQVKSNEGEKDRSLEIQLKQMDMQGKPAEVARDMSFKERTLSETSRANKASERIKADDVKAKAKKSKDS